MFKDEKQLLEMISKIDIIEKIAREIVSVQPMTESMDAIRLIRENSMSEKELIDNGYVPVDSITKLMWVKKEKA